MDLDKGRSLLGRALAGIAGDHDVAAVLSRANDHDRAVDQIRALAADLHAALIKLDMDPFTAANWSVGFAAQFTATGLVRHAAAGMA